MFNQASSVGILFALLNSQTHMKWKMNFVRQWVRFWPFFLQNLIYVQSGKFCWYTVCLTRKPNRISMKNELHAKMSQISTIFRSKPDSCSIRQVLLVYFLLCSIAKSNKHENELRAKMTQILIIFCSNYNSCSIRQVLLVYFLPCLIAKPI